MQIKTPLIAASCAAALAVAGACLAGYLWPDRVGGLIEARLARETGLRWRIGGLGLDLSPGLVLTDVTIRDEARSEGLSGHLDQVRATGSLGLLFGRAGTVQAQVEGARVMLPLAGRSRAAGPGDGGDRRDGIGAGPGVLAIRAALRAAEAASTDGGRTIALSAGGADLALDLAAAPTGREPAIRIDLPERGALVEIADGAAKAARRITLTLAPGDGPRIAATAEARLDGSSLRLDRIAGTIDQAAFTGSLVAEGIGTRPRVTAGLQLDALALTGAGTATRADPVAGITVPVRTDRVPDPAWFSGFEGHATVSVRSLALGPVLASAVGMTARVQDGRLDASLDAAALYGGTARGRYVLEPDGRTGRHEIGLGLSGVRVGPLLRDATGLSSLDGTGRARLDVQAQGAALPALLRSAAGRAEISVVDGRMDGLDLARAGGLTRLGGLTTRLDALGAHLTVGDGRATTDDLQLRTGLIEAEGRGVLDLLAGTIDLRLEPRAVGAGGGLAVPVRIAGPWDDPSVSADFAGLARDPAGTLDGLRNLGARILGGDGSREDRQRAEDGRDGGLGDGGLGDGGLGDGLGGLLDGLLGRDDRPRRRP